MSYSDFLWNVTKLKGQLDAEEKHRKDMEARMKSSRKRKGLGR